MASTIYHLPSVITCLSRLIAPAGGSRGSRANLSISHPMAWILAAKLAAIKVLQGDLCLPRRKSR